MSSNLAIPDSDICTAAFELARDYSPEFLFNHVLRTFLFGEAAGLTAGSEYDREMLFLGCALHDLGLVEEFIREGRFEIDGADAAAEFLSKQGYSDIKIAVIWDAIALHTTLDYPQRKQPEVALVQMGAGLDVGIFPLDILQPEKLEQILDAYPRLGFKKAMLETMAGVVALKPMTGMVNVMGDVGHRCVDEFGIPNFCDVVEAAGFDE